MEHLIRFYSDSLATVLSFLLDMSLQYVHPPLSFIGCEHGHTQLVVPYFHKSKGILKLICLSQKLKP